MALVQLAPPSCLPKQASCRRRDVCVSAAGSRGRNNANPGASGHGNKGIDGHHDVESGSPGHGFSGSDNSPKPLFKLPPLQFIDSKHLEDHKLQFIKRRAPRAPGSHLKTSGASAARLNKELQARMASCRNLPMLLSVVNRSLSGMTADTAATALSQLAELLVQARNSGAVASPARAAAASADALHVGPSSSSTPSVIVRMDGTVTRTPPSKQQRSDQRQQIKEGSAGKDAADVAGNSRVTNASHASIFQASLSAKSADASGASAADSSGWSSLSGLSLQSAVATAQKLVSYILEHTPRDEDMYGYAPSTSTPPAAKPSRAFSPSSSSSSGAPKSGRVSPFNPTHKVRVVGQTLVAVARLKGHLPLRPEDAAALHALAISCGTDLFLARPQELCTLLAGMCALSIRPGASWLSHAATVAQSKFYAFNARQFASLAISIAALESSCSNSSSSSNAAVSKQGAGRGAPAAGRRSSSSQQQLLLQPQLRITTALWLHAFCTYSRSILSGCSITHLGQMLHGLLRLGHVPEEAWWAAVCTAALPSVPNADPGSCVLFLSWTARANMKLPASLSSALLDQIIAKADTLMPMHDCKMAAALANLHVQPDEAWLAAWLESARGRLPVCAPGQLTALLVGLGEMRYLPSREWLAAWLNAAEGSLSNFTPRNVLSAYQVFARWQVKPPQPFLYKLRQSIYGFVTGYPAKELAGVLHCMASLNDQPDRKWLMSVLGRMAQLSSAQASSSSNSGGAQSAGAPAPRAMLPTTTADLLMVFHALQNIVVLQEVELPAMHTAELERPQMRKQAGRAGASLQSVASVETSEGLHETQDSGGSMHQEQTAGAAAASRAVHATPSGQADAPSQPAATAHRGSVGVLPVAYWPAMQVMVAAVQARLASMEPPELYKVIVALSRVGFYPGQAFMRAHAQAAAAVSSKLQPSQKQLTTAAYRRLARVAPAMAMIARQERRRLQERAAVVVQS